MGTVFDSNEVSRPAELNVSDLKRRCESVIEEICLNQAYVIGIRGGSGPWNSLAVALGVKINKAASVGNQDASAGGC